MTYLKVRLKHTTRIASTFYFFKHTIPAQLKIKRTCNPTARVQRISSAVFDSLVNRQRMNRASGNSMQTKTAGLHFNLKVQIFLLSLY